ncbi:MAG TPA: C1 family peptidase [Candidatus Acidoferrum sp.]|nr:C1 family peptidase [Candidatus Acidoferrum sp.]
MKTTVLATTLLLTLVAGAFAQTAGQLDAKMIGQIQAKFDALGDQTAAINAVTNNDINSLSLNRDELIAHSKLFSVKLKAAGITNQQGSGRCWLFAGLNTLSPGVMAKLKLSEFEFSQPYLTFWDKMEKANLFLEQIIDLRNAPIDDRKLVQILNSPFGDGGWFRYVTDLMDKYGVVPLSAMPETKQSINTGTINYLADVRLKADASELRSMAKSGKSVDQLRQRKVDMLSDIYKLLVFAYGKPPKEFTFRYEAKDSTVVPPKTYTPMSFYHEFVTDKLPTYVTLMNNPSKDYDKTYQIDESRNMADKQPAILLNLPMNSLKQYCMKMLIDSQPVWFACDVGMEHLRDSAILEAGIYEPSKVFGIDFNLSKADLIAYRESTPNHAMVLLGVDTTADGKPLKWLVENSWGATRGDKGYWYMYDNWFEQYAYFVIIDKKYLSADDARKLEQKPVQLPIWDPFYSALR